MTPRRGQGDYLARKSRTNKLAVLMYTALRTILTLCLVMSLLSQTIQSANADTGIRQYQAALTRIFLWKYYAMPVFRRNPIFPGDVIRLDNEDRFLSYMRCYENQDEGDYVAVDPYTEGTSVATSINVKVKGEILSKHVADIEAEGTAKFEEVSIITVDPLSAEDFEPDSAALWDWNRNDEKCKIIDGLLAGTTGKYVVVAEVLHGSVNFSLRTNFGAGIGVAAQSKVIKKIAKLFGIREAGISMSSTSASFAVSTSPGPKTQAIVPAEWSREELARITYFMRGDRGASLEKAVLAALSAGDTSVLDEVSLWIKNLLGDEIENKEHWAQRFLVGGPRISLRELREKTPDDISLRSVANYAAAMVILP